MRKYLLGLLMASSAFAADLPPTDIDYWRFWSSGAFSNHTIDGTSDTLEVVMVCPYACTIDAIGFRYGARTGTTPQNRVSVQGVTATTGRADGSIKNSGNAKQEFNPPNDATWDDTVQVQTLDATYACAAGETIALVIDDDPGDGATIDASNNSSYSYAHSGASGYLMPYSFRYDGSSASRSGAPPPVFARCGTQTIGWPLLSSTNGGLSSSSTPDERGNLVYLPADSCATAEICGAGGYIALSNTSSDTEINVYDGTSEQVEFVMDASTVGTADSFRVFFSTPYVMTCGDTDVSLTFRPQTTNGITLGEVDVAAQQDWTAYPGGSEVYAVTRSDNSGAFSTNTTRRYSIYPIFCDITEPSASGGGKKSTFNRGLN